MKKLLLGFATVLCLVATAEPARAQDWPQQKIQIIVSFGPGGGADIVGRILAEAMQDRFGTPVIVENKPGAGGILGNYLVAKAAPDGYTIGIMTAGQIIAAVTRKVMPYDTTALTPVTRVAEASLMMVTRPDFPANNVKELVALAKADPGKIVFASPGFAATQHFAGELFKQIAGVNLLHVPYRSSPEAVGAVLGKQVDVLFDTVSALIGQVQSGSLKALAVTGKNRFPAVPDVPAAIESGLLPGMTSRLGMVCSVRRASRVRLLASSTRRSMKLLPMRKCACPLSRSAWSSAALHRKSSECSWRRNTSDGTAFARPPASHCNKLQRQVQPS